MYPLQPLRLDDAKQLFSDRVAAREPDLDAGTPEEVVDAICRRLDCLPLALELAAARTAVLSPTQILERLSGRLDLFRGARDLDQRQQTLRATIAWSHDLLGEPARRLLAACSVFRGGIGLDHIEAVCASALRLGVPVLDALNELVDQSLLRLGSSSAAVPRYAMLETVRDFAAEQLGDLPEQE